MTMKAITKINLSALACGAFLGSLLFVDNEPTQATKNNADTNFGSALPERTKEQCDIPIVQNRRTTQGYLRCIISEQPLSPEEARNLPSFTGKARPADPFAFRI